MADAPPPSSSTNDKTVENVATVEGSLQVPDAAVRPPRKISKPKITLKMPPLSPQMQIPPYYQTPGGIAIPLTPATGLSPSYPINFFQAYPNKAQEFMFKQFEGFKDFTKNTGKLGLNFGEKFAFWMYGKVRELSQNGFTHIFLFLIICLYCALGGFIFYLVENEHQENIREKDLRFEDQLVVNITKNINKIYLQSNSSRINAAVQAAKVSAEVNKLAKHFRVYYSIHEQKWDALNWVYFCGTIFTTIDRSV